MFSACKSQGQAWSRNQKEASLRGLLNTSDGECSWASGTHGRVKQISLGGRNIFLPQLPSGGMLGFSQQLCRLHSSISVINATILWCRAATSSVITREFFCWPI